MATAYLTRIQKAIINYKFNSFASFLSLLTNIKVQLMDCNAATGDTWSFHETVAQKPAIFLPKVPVPSRASRWKYILRKSQQQKCS